MQLYPKFYWQNREGEAVAGCGEADEGPRFFLQNFCSKSDPAWNSFYAFTPSCLEKGSEPSNPLPFSPPLAKKRKQSCKEWISMVENALFAIQEKKFEKVVVAKKVSLETLSPVDPLALLSNLKRPGQFAFCIQPSPQIAFLGSTPERLYRRIGRIIECDALAGTRPLHLENELLRSEKDLREFRIVEQAIVQTLAKFCRTKPTLSKLSISRTSTLCHLHTNITGELKEGVNDEVLIQALHPSPAVGGWPRRAAMNFLKKHECFARGLYAAPIGLLEKERAELAVGIRSCLIVGSRISLFAGTGIVAGSDPLAEWKESEQKLQHWSALFHEQ